MQLVKKIMFGLLVLIGMGTCMAYGSDCDQYTPCCYQSGIGLVTGIYGSFQTVFFSSRDLVTEIVEASRQISRFNSNQRAPGGGGFVSYGFLFCDRFVVAFRFDGLGLANNAEHSYRLVILDEITPALRQDILSQQLALRWSLDLTCQPGSMVGDRFFFYFKGGGTLARVRQQVLIKSENVPSQVVDEAVKNHRAGGYVLGTGVNVSFNSCLSLFVEYNWRAYISHLSSLQINRTDAPVTSVDSRITDVHSSGFVFGLATRF